MSDVGSVEGLRTHKLQAHGIEAPDAALDFALRRARNYSGSEPGVYSVAAKWVRDAAEGACPACGGRDLGTTDGPDGLQHQLVCGVCTPLPPSADLD